MEMTANRNVTSYQKGLVLAFRNQDVKKIKRYSTILERRVMGLKLLGINKVSW